MYSGALSTKETLEIVEETELVLDIGGVSLNDENHDGLLHASRSHAVHFDRVE
jgi:TPP-dependent 2-oxoacid decarboxylase